MNHMSTFKFIGYAGAVIYAQYIAYSMGKMIGYEQCRADISSVTSSGITASYNNSIVTSAEKEMIIRAVDSFKSPVS